MIYAHDPEADRIIFAHEADESDELVCPECSEPLSLIGPHQRAVPSGGVTTVAAHFKHPPESSCGGGSESGGGESDHHKNRKYQALSVATREFDCESWGLEVTIGANTADASVTFVEPHSEYGRGFAIEYQYKNESKDIHKTERNFAENEYTTLWLWEDQFDESSATVDVDLFGGRVVTPWPLAVPSEDEWDDRKHDFRHIRERWFNAPRRPLSESAAAVRLPREWYDETSQGVWKSVGWEEKFTPPDEFLNFWDYPVVEATFPGAWYKPTEIEYWRQTDWKARFRGTANEYLGLPIHWSKPVEIPSAKWILDEGVGEEYLRELWDAHDAALTEFEDKKLKRSRCPECGEMAVHDPIHPGEVARGTRCTNCKTWYTVFPREG